MQYHLADNLAHNLAFAFHLFGLKRKLMLNNFWTIFDTPGLTENSTPQQHQKKLFPRLLPGLQDRLRQASWKQPALASSERTSGPTSTKGRMGHIDVHSKSIFKKNL